MANRRALYGILLFGGLILLCFGFALAVLYKGDGSSSDDGGPRIGIVTVKGVILGSKKQLEELRRWRKDETVKAIVVRIESPGGAVGPSQEIYREIERTRAKKPVVASMGAAAASGGYYIAAACDRIVASPGTITGSIGVITTVTDVSQVLALAKIQTTTFVSGPLKDTGSALRPLREEDRRFLQGFVAEVYRQFVRDVAKGRKLAEAKVKPHADGRVLSGEQAKAAGLVDELGNFSDALAAAATLAKAKGEPVAVYPRERKSLLAELLSESMESAVRAAGEELRAAVARERAVSVEARDPSLAAP
jgi:protease-4